VFECAETLGVPTYLHPTVPPAPVVDAYYGGFDPCLSAKLSTAGVGWHIHTGIHCLRLILGGVFDRFPVLQIIVSHQFEALSWIAWRADHSFPPNESGLKRTIKSYLRENFYGGILAGEYATQDPGAMDSGWSLSFNAYLGMVNVVGIDRIVFTTDYPYGSLKAARQFSRASRAPKHDASLARSDRDSSRPPEHPTVDTRSTSVIKAGASTRYYTCITRSDQLIHRCCRTFFR
jgi:uncharacterized protein